MRPLGHRIVVIPGKIQPLESGLILPESSTELREGEVLFIGTKTVDIKVGETVLYPPDSGDSFKYNDQSVLIIDEGQIISVLK